MRINIPLFIRPFLWSYNIKKLDDADDKKRIITNILNIGTKEATDWLFKVFDKKDIQDAVQNPYRGEWSDKSLRFWSLVLDIRLRMEGKE